MSDIYGTSSAARTERRRDGCACSGWIRTEQYKTSARVELAVEWLKVGRDCV
jgi:hypothetical protein